MIDKYFDTPDDIDLLDRWMSAPPEKRPVLDERLADRLERMVRAHRWLTAHYSRRKVWPMMHAFYTSQGRKYSELTARNDVIDAERLFLKVTPHTGPYVTGLMIDSLFEEYHSALRAGQKAEAQKFSIALDKYIDRWDRYVKEREEASTAPIPIIGVFDLKEANIPEDPNIHEKIQQWKASREKKINPPPPATDAEFTEEPDAP
ncbi:MAG TPA: hypothetical protein PLB89_04740 [Flavobacteriales bacterium]|nr:hypothetical protein [Flavobacteriales bacterium]